MRLAFNAAISAILAIGLAPISARADDAAATTDDPPEACESVNAPIVTSYFVDGCTSPLGICTEGYIASGPLAGTTMFNVFGVGPGDSPELLLYTGGLFISTDKGDLSIQDSGVLNGLDGSFFESDVIVGGTGTFTRSAGTLFSKGVVTPTGFEGTIFGMMCTLADRPSEDF